MKKKALEQLGVVVLLWLCVVVATGIAHIIKKDAKSPFPVDAIERFVNFDQILALAAAGALLFFLFKALPHRPKDPEDRRRGDYFADVILDELGGAAYNFGALVAVCALFGATAWYWALAVACFVVGYFLKPGDSPNVASGS